MKGVILEKKDKYAAVLMEDGTVRKLRTKAEVGSEIDFAVDSVSRRKRSRLPYIAAAAVLFLTLISTGGYNYVSAQAVSYVTVDTDSSIEFGLNRRNQVVSYKALSEEGAEIVAELEALGLGRCSLSEALSATEEIMEQHGHLSKDHKDYMLINIISDDENVIDKLRHEIEDSTTDNDSLEVYVSESTLEEREEAGEAGMSSGRYKEYKEDTENGNTDGSSPEEYKERSVEELIENRAGNAPETEFSEETQNPEGPRNGSDTQDPEGSSPSGGEGNTPPEMENKEGTAPSDELPDASAEGSTEPAIPAGDSSGNPDDHGNTPPSEGEMTPPEAPTETDNEQ